MVLCLTHVTGRNKKLIYFFIDFENNILSLINTLICSDTQFKYSDKCNQWKYNSHRNKIVFPHISQNIILMITRQKLS